jgi:hypothetical protein
MAKTEIRFVSGFDEAAVIVPLLRTAGFTHRFAVIQETYRSDQVDMYFDEALWRCLFELVKTFAPDSQVSVETYGVGEEPVAGFLPNDPRLNEPFDFVVARKGERPILCMVTEFWNRFGGPEVYHDSYTYALYSHEQLDAHVISLLRQSKDSDLWDISEHILPPTAEAQPPTEIVPLWRRVWRLLAG